MSFNSLNILCLPTSMLPRIIEPVWFPTAKPLSVQENQLAQLELKQEELRAVWEDKKFPKPIQPPSVHSEEHPELSIPHELEPDSETDQYDEEEEDVLEEDDSYEFIRP